MASGIGNFGLTSSGNNVQFSITREGFFCLNNPQVVITLFDNSTNNAVASLSYTSGVGTTGTISGTFSNIYDGIFYAVARFICDGTDLSTFETLTHVHSSTISPPGSTAPPSNAPFSPGTNNVNSDHPNNSNFCIATNESDISFSRLNQIFGRAGSTPNTELSGLFNPSQAPSLIGLSTLRLGEPNPPSKLRDNAVSEFRGTCSYAAPNQYVFALVFNPIFNDLINNEIVRSFEGVWIHPSSGNITNRCPFDNSRVQVFTSVAVIDAYSGSTVPNPYWVRVTRIPTSGSSTTLTTTRSATSQGTTSANRNFDLNYRDRIVGELRARAVIVGATSTFRVACRANTTANGYDRLAGIDIGRVNNQQEVRIDYVLPSSGNFTYTWSNAVSGGTSSNLNFGLVNNTTTTSASGSGQSSATGSRTVSLTPSPTNLNTVLTIRENGAILYSVSQVGSQSTSINFQAGNSYEITALCTSSIQ